MDERGGTAAGGPHIGYLVQQFPPEVGAGPARVAEMALRWRRAGAQVSIFTGMPNRPAGVVHPEYRGKLGVHEDWHGLDVHRSWLYASPRHGFGRTLANNLSFMVTGAAATARRAGRMDVLIASSPPFFVHAAGELVRRARRVPLVLEVRDLWPDYLVGMGKVRGRAAGALFAMERGLLRRAAHVVVVTESFASRIAEKGVDPTRITVIPNAVDEALYYRAQGTPPFPELLSRDGELVVGYLGNFGMSQDLSSVVRAAALLYREGARVRFVLAGDGTDRARVLEAAAQAGVPTVTIHPSIPREQTRAFYNACGACLVPLAAVPQLQDTIPSKLFEIMACEVPVVASLAGEGARVVRAAGAGLVARAGDPRSIADAVRRMADQPPAERARMGAAARAYVLGHFNRAGLADRYLELLRRVAAHARGPGGESPA